MNLLRISLGLVIIGILILSLIPPHSGVRVEVNDKIGHFIAYAVLTLNAGLVFSSRKQLYIITIVAFLFGAAIELLQGFVPGRETSWYDLVANSIGVLIGAILLTIFASTIERILKKLKIL